MYQKLFESHFSFQTNFNFFLKKSISTHQTNNNNDPLVNIKKNKIRFFCKIKSLSTN